VSDTRDILIHIGTHKTGSTSLQQLLTRASDRLFEDGILYPEAGRPDEHWPPYGHHLLAWSIQQKRGLSARAEWNRVIDEAEKTPASLVLISSEEFESCTRVEIQKIRSFFPQSTVRALVYLRDPVDYIISQYKQNISTSGETRSFRSFAEALIDRCDYNALVQRWEEGLGEPVIVRSFETCREGEGLEKSFLNAIGVDSQEYETFIRQPVNISPSERQVLVTKRLNRLQSLRWMPERFLHRVRRSVLRGGWKGRVITRVVHKFLEGPLYTSEELKWLKSKTSNSVTSFKYARCGG